MAGAARHATRSPRPTTRRRSASSPATSPSASSRRAPTTTTSPATHRSRRPRRWPPPTCCGSPSARSGAGSATATSRRRSCWRSWPGPTCRAPIWAQLTFNGPPRGHRAPRTAGDEGAVAAEGGRRRGAHLDRHHRARRRLRRPGDAHGAAAPTARGWRLNGYKNYSTLGHVAQGILVWCRWPGGDGRQGHRRGRHRDATGRACRSPASTTRWACTPSPRPSSRSTTWRSGPTTC